MNGEDLSREKTRWRLRLRRLRAALSPEERRGRSEEIRRRVLRLQELEAARRIFCFISHGDEVETRKLIDDLRDMGKSLLVPRILARTHMIAVPFPGWEHLVPGTLGILTPESDEEDPDPVDLSITPGLGFTPSGARLGFGRGYYDQWFSTHEAVLKVAVCFECQVVEELPVDATDVPVDRIVTERRCIDAIPQSLKL